MRKFFSTLFGVVLVLAVNSCSSKEATVAANDNASQKDNAFTTDSASTTQTTKSHPAVKNRDQSNLGASSSGVGH